MNKEMLARISCSAACGELLKQNASFKKFEDVREVGASIRSLVEYSKMILGPRPRDQT